MEMNLGIDIRQLAEICNFLASDQNHLGDGNGFFADLIGVERQGGPEYTVTIKCRTEFTGREKVPVCQTRQVNWRDVRSGQPTFRRSGSQVNIAVGPSTGVAARPAHTGVVSLVNMA